MRTSAEASKDGELNSGWLMMREGHGYEIGSTGP